VLRGIEMDAEVIIKATKVDGIYTSDPVEDADARFIPEISFMEVMTRELKVMDAAAISLCKENNLPIIVLNLSEPGSVLRAIRGERIGSFVRP
jgi:uridylate kinase